MAQITNTQSVNYGDNNTNSWSINGSFNNTFIKSDEDAQIMRWLSPLEPNVRHQGVRTRRYANVGGWVLETSEFREWRGEGGADKAVLFCSGNPGVGKTYLSSLVVDRLCDQANERDTAVACLYYDFLAQQEQTIINMVGAILKQLVGRGEIPKYLRDAFKKGKREIGGRGLLLADMVQMLMRFIASIPQVFICIDGLDECLPKDLPELLELLRDIVRGSPKTRIFFTGRPHVREDLQRYFLKVVVIPITPNTDDIKDYVEMRLGRDTAPEAMNQELRADIVKIIMEKISDIFLLVSLNIDAILGEVTICQRRRKVQEMTRGNGLSDAYSATLARLKAQKGNKSILGLRALMWVSHSERPLRADELCHALGVEIRPPYLDPENVPALRTLLACCLGLVTVEESSSTIRLVHFTLQEYLASDPTLFHSPHSTIGEVCLMYLNFKSVNNLSPTLDSPPSTMPFLEYASCFWGKHIKREMTENARILALRLLNRFEDHISAQLLLLSRNEDGSPGPYFFKTTSGPSRFTGLHGLAFFGIVEIVEAAFGMKEWNVNASDSMGSTALAWAAARGHEEVVSVLLERGGANPNQADVYDRTPLWWAARYGHERVVEILLEQGDVNPNKANPYHGKTPFALAVEYGHEQVAKILLEQEGVSRSQVNTKYRVVPRSYNMARRHEGVVGIYPQWGGANPSQAVTKNIRTPLSWPAGCGHEGAVQMLPEQVHINPNKANPYRGKTLLTLAAECGHERVVDMLLERGDLDPNQADTKSGMTPLSLAARGGNEGVVKVLLGWGDVNPNQADTFGGQTPLSRAAEHGRERVVKMLLEHRDVNPNKADILGRTPLLLAAEHGHDGVVKVLLERGGVNANQADTFRGQTPLFRAVEHGHEGVVKMLLGRGDVDPNQVDTEDGWTPLSRAAEHGHERVVKLLLERKDVRSATPDNQNQTPLSLALSKGHDGIVKILQERECVKSDRADHHSQSSLSPSIPHGDEGVVEMQHGGGNPNTEITDPNDQPTLPPAESDQRKEVLEPADFVPKSADVDIPSTEPPRLPKRPSIWSRKFWRL